MRILDLFSGTHSVSKVFDKDEIITVDIDPKYNPTHLVNIVKDIGPCDSLGPPPYRAAPEGPAEAAGGLGWPGPWPSPDALLREETRVRCS